jgi:hypothetical protein
MGSARPYPASHGFAGDWNQFIIQLGKANQVVYTMGSIDPPEINRYLVDVLEGTRPAFDNRGSKYYAS